MTHSPGWNFATVWEAIAQEVPHAPAQIQGSRRLTWTDFDRRAGGVAAALLELGLRTQDTVALCLYNCPEYLESAFACCKARLVPVNTNYRYRADELVHLWQDADAASVIFHGTLADRVAEARPRVPGVRAWLWVDDGGGACPAWASPYEAAAESGNAPAPRARSGDDLILFYTGGTTGMPKGVMWRQDDLFRAETADLEVFDPTGPPDLAAVRDEARAPGPVSLPASPLMHGTAFYSQLGVLATGGAVVTLEQRSFDPVAVLDAVERERVTKLVIVGDVFARPLRDALDAEPARWDISSLETVVSAGTLWSQEVKAGLLRHHPSLRLWDALGSSEAMGLGRSLADGGPPAATGTFQPGENVRVLDDAGADVVAGSGRPGRIAIRGFSPLGYHKDPVKTAQTFVELDGDRYVIPGDYATLEADGTLRLLGRGSSCINTGGEKVYPEEVEAVIKELPGVADCAVVGVPDVRFGSAVAAFVEPDPDVHIDETAVIDHVKARLAGYKAPRHVLIAAVGRGPNGKVDHRVLQARARAAAAAPA